MYDIVVSNYGEREKEENAYLREKDWICFFYKKKKFGIVAKGDFGTHSHFPRSDIARSQCRLGPNSEDTVIRSNLRAMVEEECFIGSLYPIT
jgi:hypothetical protein